MCGCEGRTFSNLKGMTVATAQATLRALFLSQTIVSPFLVSISVDKVDAAPQVQVNFNDPQRLKLGLREVNFLLNNWEEKTVYCNFGEFQNELLAPENKEKLFKAAAEFSILDYDKSKTMNVKCKRDPQVVRAFLGLTPDNLLLNKADVLMRRPGIMNLIDDGKIDDYLEAVEVFTQAVANVDTLSYEARTDFASTETAIKGDDSKFTSTSNDYLAQSKISVISARDALKTVVDILAL